MPRRRVLLGFQEVGGHYAGLAAGMRALGRDVDQLLLVADPSRHAGRRAVPGLEWIAGLHRRLPLRPGWWRAALLVLLLPLRLALSLAIACRYRAVVVAYGRTPTHPALDLWLWRLTRLRIIVVFHGSDIRPPWLDGAAIHDRDLAHAPLSLLRRLSGLAERPADLAARLAATARQRRLRARCACRLADTIISWAGNDHYLDRPYLHFAGLGRCQPDAATRGAARTVGGVVHCPSSPSVKGTALIEAAMAGLPAVPYQRISGVANADALAAMAGATLVVDQLYSDIAMPGVATEAAWLGIPAVVGSYTDPHPAELAMDPPALRCRPAELPALLRRQLADPVTLLHHGRLARAWVERHWSPELVTRRWLALIDGCRVGALLDPRESPPGRGCGVRPADAARTLRLLAGTPGASRWLAGARRCWPRVRRTA